MDAITQVPVPANEPVHDYAPKSPERTRLRTELASLADHPIDLPHTGGRQAQPVTDLAGGDRSGFQQQAHNGPTSVTVRDCRGDSGRDRRDFHNISVTKFR